MWFFNLFWNINCIWDNNFCIPFPSIIRSMYTVLQLQLLCSGVALGYWVFSKIKCCVFSQWKSPWLSYIRNYSFLHYLWFLQNFERVFLRTNLHTTVRWSSGKHHGSHQAVFMKMSSRSCQEVIRQIRGHSMATYVDTILPFFDHHLPPSGHFQPWTWTKISTFLTTYHLFLST